MFKRLFFAMLGLGAGVALGVTAVRKVEQTRRRLAPDQLAATASARAGSWRDRVEEAVADGRQAAAAKETELRAVYRRKPVQPPPRPAPSARPADVAPPTGPTAAPDGDEGPHPPAGT